MATTGKFNARARRFAALGCLLSLGFGLGLADRANAQQSAEGDAAKPAPRAAALPATIATIDMDAVFKAYDKVKESSDQFRAAAMAEQQKLTKFAADIQVEMDKLRKLQPDSDTYRELESKVTEMQVKHKSMQERAGREFSRREAESMAALYKEIQAMAARVAAHKGYTLVIQGPATEMDTGDPNRLLAAMARTVVYADPRSDITNDVIFNLNHFYKQAKAAAAPAPGAAAPAPADADKAVRPAKGQ